MGRPLSAVAWILAVLALPYLGVVLWWVLGRSHLRRPTLRKRRSQAQLRQSGPTLPADPRTKASLRHHSLSFLFDARNFNDGLFPPLLTATPSIHRGAETFELLTKEIAGAQQEVRLLFYTWQNDRSGRLIRDLLVERAKAGVRVRVLVDAIGSSGLGKHFMDPLKQAGGRFGVFLPVRFRPWAPTINFRNHRKLVVIDDRIVFTGGINIGDQYAGEWNDFGVRFTGSISEHFDEIFRVDWHFATGETLPALPVRTDSHARVRGSKKTRALCCVIASGPDRRENLAHDAFFAAIAGAKKRVWLMSPYFVPGPALQTAMRSAALRGVDVRVIIPQKSDVPFVQLASRSFQESFLSSGIRVFEYGPNILHAKALLVDDELTAIGSANADVRSFRLNFEVVCFVLDKAFNKAVAQLFSEDQKSSTAVTARQLRQRGRLQRLAQSAAHLLSPIL